MRAFSIAVAIALIGCPKKQEKAQPVPEAQDSAPPAKQHDLHDLTCRDGVLGAPIPTPDPAPSTSSVPRPSSSGGSLAITGLFADAGPMFAPIGDGGVGLGSIGGFGGIGTGTALGRPRRMHVPIVAAPVSARDDRALAIAKSACAAEPEIRKCHDASAHPVVSLDYVMSFAHGKANVAVSEDAGEDALRSCVASALAAVTYDDAITGTLDYRVSFETPVRAPPSTMKDSGADVKGSLPPEIVRRIVRANFGRLRLCYEMTLRTDPKAAGKLALRFTVDKDGNVASASVEDATLTDPKLHACLVRTIKSLSFPRPDPTGEVVVKYPLTFATGD